MFDAYLFLFKIPNLSQVKSSYMLQRTSATKSNNICIFTENWDLCQFFFLFVYLNNCISRREIMIQFKYNFSLKNVFAIFVSLKCWMCFVFFLRNSQCLSGAIWIHTTKKKYDWVLKSNNVCIFTENSDLFWLIYFYFFPCSFV